MTVLGKEMYTHRCTSTFMHIYYHTHMHYMCGFWAHQVSSGLCPLLLLLLCPCTSWGTSNSTFIEVLVLCFAVYNMLFVRYKGDGDYQSLPCGLVEGGTVPLDTQNMTWVALYEGALLGSAALRLPQVYPSVNLILRSQVQCCLQARQICSFSMWGENPCLLI